METLHTWYLWIVAHWALISLIAGALVAVCSFVNKLTASWEHHAGLARVLLVVTEVLSVLASKDIPTWFKWPFTVLGAKKYALKQRLRAARSSLGPKITMLLVLLVGLLSSACVTHPVSPRHCKHLDAAELGGTPWADPDCRKAQVKRDAFLASTLISGALGAIAGSLVGIKTENGWRIGWGVSAGALGAIATGLAPFLASSQKNLSEHCVEYLTPIPGPASRPAGARP